MKPAAPGLQAVYTTVPGPETTAAAIGNDGVSVVSTPHIIGLLEEASHRAVRDLFEAGEATVGTRVDIAHLAPAFTDRAVVCTGTLTEVDGRRLRFAVRATQDGKEIMSGHHERALIRLDRFRFAGDAAAAPSTGTSVTFFFDYHSPWCYLAVERIAAIAARCRRAIEWKPMHLANLIERIDGRRPLEANPAFVRWFKQDMQDWAALLHVSLRYHPDFPLRPSRALRASSYADTQGRAYEFVRTTMRAYWSESRDISDLEVLGDIGAAVGLDRAAVIGSAGDETFKSMVDANTNEAIARGVFGAPTFFVDGKMFWGNDRLEMMERYLSGALAGRQSTSPS
jgi:2-hydroxychromene-2-carboxylate isomerase/predicted thioesterase